MNKRGMDNNGYSQHPSESQCVSEKLNIACLQSQHLELGERNVRM